MGFWKTVKWLLVAGAIGAGVYFYKNPKEFQKFKAETEQIFKQITEEESGLPAKKPPVKKPPVKSKKEKPVKINGEYSCSDPKLISPHGKPELGMLPVDISTLYVCREDDGLIVSNGSPFFRVNANERKNGFDFAVSGTHLVEGVGKAKPGGTLTFSLTRSGYGMPPFTLEYSCNYRAACPGEKPEPKEEAEEEKPKKDDLIRAVFIRPCEGQLYKSFDTGKTLVGGGTVNGVCKDLEDSGFTDVFVGFKVDHLGKGCGNHYGELLHPSKKFPDNVSERVKETGFDPIKALMNACTGIRFHAWFPVFKDEKAVEYANAKGEKGGLKIVRQNAIVVSDIFADPRSKAVLEYQCMLLDEIVARYPVVGINLDYIRYPADEDLPGSQFTVDSKQISAFVKKILWRYNNKFLSADVMAGEARRKDLGQDDILTQVEWIMPMTYTYMSFGGPEEVEKWATDLRSNKKYRGKKIIPILRGWIEGINDPRSMNIVTDLRLDIAAAKSSNPSGYAIFTYESFLWEFDKGNKKLGELIENLDQ